MGARREDRRSQTIPRESWFLSPAVSAAGCFSPAAGMAVRVCCQGLGHPWGSCGQNLETRGAPRIELWERIAITTNCLLLKRGKYVTPSKGEQHSKGNTCLKHTGQVYLKGKLVCFWFFITFPIETSKYSCHIFGRGCLILNLKHLNTHTYINMVSISFSCGTSNSCLL